MAIQDARDLINSSDADFLSHMEKNNLNTNSGISGFYSESGLGIGPASGMASLL